MKVLKKIVMVLVILVAVYVVLALLGPSNYKVTRSIKIAAPAEMVYNQVSKFPNWEAWSPWRKMDSAAIYTISADVQQVGASMGWKGEIVGAGVMTTTELVTNEKATYELVFTEPFSMTSYGGFNITQEGDSVTLEWYDEAEIGFANRPMMLFMDMEEQIGPSFEEGLAEIKKICEATEVVKPVEIVQESLEAMPILYIEESATLENDSIALKLGEAYGEIMALVGVSGLEMGGAPMAITTEFSMENKFWAFNAAIPVSYPEGFEVKGRIKMDSTYAGNAVKGIHIGAYDQCPRTYEALENYVQENGLEITGNPWEVYIDDPTKVATAELRTHIYFPVK
jgi:effector-binding domain-containing protein